MSALSAAERTQRYDIPLGHLEYDFIRECKDGKVLEKIVKVLRSGEEGKYPDLEDFAERRLTTVNPKSKVLRKAERVATPRDLDRSEWEKIAGDLESWTSDMKTTEKALHRDQTAGEEPADSDLPPIRGQSCTIHTDKAATVEENTETSSKSSSKKDKRVKPREYREWDKFDIDAELAKVDDGREETASEEKAPKTSNVLRKASKPAIPDKVDTTGLSDHEKAAKATTEKEKGNEAFRAGDFEEALLYYNRSLSLVATVAAFNNRAQAYLKLKEWDKAFSDCQTVLEREPSNLKGVLRRAVAYKGKKQFTNAKNDLQKVLSADPGNKRAQDILDEVEKELSQQKVKGRRIVIQESDGSDSEAESTEKPPAQPESKPDTLVNGIHEETSQKETNVSEKSKESHAESPKCIWEEEELTKPEQKSEASKNLTETSQKAQQQSKPSEKTKINESPAAEKTEGSGGGSKGGKGSKRKKKGKGSAKHQNQTHQQSAKKVDQPEPQKKTEVEEIKSQPPTVSQPTVVDETDSVGTTSEVASTPSDKSVAPPAATTEVPSQPEVVPPPPQKTLPANVVKIKTAGNDLFKIGQYGEAIGHYDKGIDLLKKDAAGHEANLAVLYSNRAACKLKVGDCEGCVRDCNESLELQPASIKPLTRRAQAYEMMEKFRRAYMDFRQVLYLDTSVDVAMQGVNRCMQHLQQVDGPRWREKLPSVNMAGLTSQAAPTTITPVSTPNDAPPTHPPRSQTTPPKATPAAEPTLTKEEQFEKNKSEGNTLVQKGDYAGAVTCYTQCIAALPQQSAPYTNRALCNLRLNKPEEVVTDCDKALQLEPENIKALFRRAQAYKMMEKYDESFRDLTCLLKKDAKNTSARREFQVVINYREQAKKARLAAEKAEKEKEQKQTAEKQSTHTEKQRKRIQIQEVSDSSDSEEDEPPKAKATAAKTDKQKAAPVTPKPPPQPAKNKSQKKGKAAKSDPNPAKTEAKSESKPAKSESKPAKSESKPAKSDSKPAKSEEKIEAKSDTKSAKPEVKTAKSDAKSETKPAKSEEKTEDKSAKTDTKSTKGSKTEKGSSGGETSKSPTKDDVTTPRLVKKTPYEFLQAWTALRTTKKIEPYAKLLEQIEPEELTKVVSNKLDGDMLHTIILCVELLLDQGCADGAPLPSLFSRSLAYLQQLTYVPRFSMITMFMGAKEKKDLERVVLKLSSGASCQYLQEDLGKLRKAYDI